MKREMAMTGLRQINLYNPALIPKRELFSARLILWWLVISILLMAAVGRWALIETRSISREVAIQAGRQATERARAVPLATDGEALPTPQQVAALEQQLRAQQELLEKRRAAWRTLNLGTTADNGGPSALMRQFSKNVPKQVWLTEVRVVGSRIDVAGKTLDPLAVNLLVERLQATGYFAAKPPPAVRLERVDAPPPARTVAVFSFSVTAALSSAYADEGARQ